MPRALTPSGLALKFLREAADLSQPEVEALTGVSESLLGHYERGQKRLARGRLDRLAAQIGFGPELVELALFVAHGLLGALAAAPSAPAYPSAAERQVAERTAARVAGATLTFTRDHILRQAREARVARAHQAADKQWAVLQRSTTTERRLLIEMSVEYRNWALSVRLGEESTRAAARDVHLAIELARLALTGAQLAAGDDAWRSRLAGRARGFVANALRVQGSLRASEAELATAWREWDAGELGDPDRILPEWRLFDLEASLRRDLRQFDRALALLDRALALAPPKASGRILVKRGSVLEQAGDVAKSTVALRLAAPLVGESGDLRLRLGLEFNLGVNLCHLGHFHEAAARLPEYRKLSAGLGNQVDAAKVSWLAGRVAAGLGHRVEARTAFEQARDFFAGEEKNYDLALVSLDLAVLLLEDGDTAAVRELAAKMARIFKSEGIAREALAALHLFYDAALQEAITLDEVRGILGRLKGLGGRL